MGNVNISSNLKRRRTTINGMTGEIEDREGFDDEPRKLKKRKLKKIGHTTKKY